jgi:hypothetical protein
MDLSRDRLILELEGKYAAPPFQATRAPQFENHWSRPTCSFIIVISGKQLRIRKVLVSTYFRVLSWHSPGEKKVLGISGNLPKIGTVYLPNTRTEHYRHNNLFHDVFYRRLCSAEWEIKMFVNCEPEKNWRGRYRGLFQYTLMAFAYKDRWKNSNRISLYKSHTWYRYTDPPNTIHQKRKSL